MKPERRQTKRVEEETHRHLSVQPPFRADPKRKPAQPKEPATQQEKDDRKQGAWCCPGSNH